MDRERKEVIVVSHSLEERVRKLGGVPPVIAV